MPGPTCPAPGVSGATGGKTGEPREASLDVFSTIFSNISFIFVMAPSNDFSISDFCSSMVCWMILKLVSTVFFPPKAHLNNPANLSKARKSLLISTTSDAILAPTVVSALLWDSNFNPNLAISCRNFS